VQRQESDFRRQSDLGALQSLLFTIAAAASLLIAAGCDQNPLPQPNDPPSRPSNPSPADGEAVRGTDFSRVELSWDCDDPDGDAVSYQVNVITYEPPVKRPRPPSITHIQQPYCYLDSITHGARYVWFVTAKDEHGAYSPVSPEWEFRLTYPLYNNHFSYDTYYWWETERNGVVTWSSAYNGSAYMLLSGAGQSATCGIYQALVSSLSQGQQIVVTAHYQYTLGNCEAPELRLYIGPGLPAHTRDLSSAPEGDVTLYGIADKEYPAGTRIDIDAVIDCGILKVWVKDVEIR